MNIRIVALASLAALVSTSACGMDLIVVQAEAELACLTEVPIEFPGVAAPDGEQPSATVEDTYVEEDLGFELPDALTAEAHVSEIAMALREGMADFSFVDRAHVVLTTAAEGADLPPIGIVDVDNRDGSMDGQMDAATILLPGNQVPDLIAYFETNAIALTVEFEGRLPEQGWGMDLDVCFDVAGEYSWSP